MKPALVAVLGDEQYQNGYYSDFENSYDKYWGAFKFLERPAPGNHEFYDNHGQTGVRGLGYFDYFNGIQHGADGSETDQTVTNPNDRRGRHPADAPALRAGRRVRSTGNGWYSYNLGDWHLISLNIECADEPGGCSPTGSWFAERDRLAGAGPQPGPQRMHARLLAPADVQLDRQPVHLRQRRGPDGRHVVEAALSAPRDAYPQWARPRVLAFRPDGSGGHRRPAQRDPGVHHRNRRRGARHRDPETPNLQAWADQYYGVMKLTLEPFGYTWDYESALESPPLRPAPPRPTATRAAAPATAWTAEPARVGVRPAGRPPPARPPTIPPAGDGDEG